MNYGELFLEESPMEIRELNYLNWQKIISSKRLRNFMGVGLLQAHEKSDSKTEVASLASIRPEQRRKMVSTI